MPSVQQQAVIFSRKTRQKMHLHYEGDEFFTWSHGQGFVSKETLFSGYALRLGLFTTMNPWHCAITITYTESPDVLKSKLNT